MNLAQERILQPLAQGDTVIIQAQGNSMLPGLKPGVYVMIKPLKNSPKPGEIILFKPALVPEPWCIHRLVLTYKTRGIRKHLFKGDGNSHFDYPIPTNQGSLYGKVVAFGKTTDPREMILYPRWLNRVYWTIKHRLRLLWFIVRRKNLW